MKQPNEVNEVAELAFILATNTVLVAAIVCLVLTGHPWFALLLFMGIRVTDSSSKDANE